MDRVQGVVTKQGVDISALCNETADHYSFPPRLIVAAAIMESNIDADSERRGIWPDVSAGIWHQTVKWAAGYGLGDGTASVQNIGWVFHVLKTHLPRAADIAGQQLGRWWAQEQDGREALSRYNSPGLAWAENPNRNNIARGWEASAAYVVTEEAPVNAWAPEDVRDLFPYAPGNGTYDHRPLSAITEVVYHHGASATPASTRESELAMLHAYHGLHTRQHGWPAIGYHLAVGPSGAVYWLNGLDLITYHAMAANTFSVGICFLGDYSDQAPPEPMRTAAILARQWVAQQCGQLDLPYSGHRDHVQTSCPGGWWASGGHDLLAALPENGDDDMPPDVQDQLSYLGGLTNDVLPAVIRELEDYERELAEGGAADEAHITRALAALRPHAVTQD